MDKFLESIPSWVKLTLLALVTAFLKDIILKALSLFSSWARKLKWKKRRAMVKEIRNIERDGPYMILFAIRFMIGTVIVAIGAGFLIILLPDNPRFYWVIFMYQLVFFIATSNQRKTMIRGNKRYKKAHKLYDD